jgi:hypothetical protein
VLNRSAKEVARRKQHYRHFLKHDPEGAWVAVDGDTVAGVALALVREGVWVLSLFAVAEGYRKDTATGGWEKRCSTAPSSTPKDATGL